MYSMCINRWIEPLRRELNWSIYYLSSLKQSGFVRTSARSIWFPSVLLASMPDRQHQRSRNQDINKQRQAAIRTGFHPQRSRLFAVGYCVHSNFFWLLKLKVARHTHRQVMEKTHFVYWRLKRQRKRLIYKVSQYHGPVSTCATPHVHKVSTIRDTTVSTDMDVLDLG